MVENDKDFIENHLPKIIEDEEDFIKDHISNIINPPQPNGDAA